MDQWDTEAEVDGDHVINIIAFDNDGNQSTDEITVTVTNTVGDNNPPTCTITWPHDGDTFTEGTSLSIVAMAEDSDGTVEQIEIYEGSNLLGTYPGSACSHFWNDIGIGSYTLTAVAFDNDGASTTSEPVDITVVENASTDPVVSITSPAIDSTYNVGDYITVQATATDPDGTISKVEFYQGNTLLGTD